MAQTTRSGDHQPQHSAMFETTAHKNIYYGKFFDPVLNNELSSSSSTPAPISKSGGNATSNTSNTSNDVPHSDEPSQHSAMFEALASTSFEYDEICGLASSQQQVALSSASSSTPAKGENDNTDSPGGNYSATANTTDVPYPERAIEEDNGDTNYELAPAEERSWWRLGLRWTGWGSKPVVYEYVQQ